MDTNYTDTMDCDPHEDVDISDWDSVCSVPPAAADSLPPPPSTSDSLSPVASAYDNLPQPAPPSPTVVEADSFPPSITNSFPPVASDNLPRAASAYDSLPPAVSAYDSRPQPASSSDSHPPVASAYASPPSSPDSMMDDLSQPLTAVGMSHLPVELLMEIFSQLPVVDMLNCCQVCPQWNDVISRTTFMRYKKLYHGVRLHHTPAVEEVQSIMMENKIRAKCEHCVLHMIRFTSGYRPLRYNPGVFCNHPLYNTALALCKERFHSKEEMTCWTLMSVMVLVSHTVQHISDILTCLLTLQSDCSLPEALDAMYCMATLLLVLHRQDSTDIYTRLHYNIYCAIHLFENDTTGQSTGSSYPLTVEQQRICNYDVISNDIVKIVAYAGTGKTTTLLHYAKCRPDLKFVLIVFNKSVQEHASSRFPENVSCKTAHSLTYSKYGRRFRDCGKLTESLYLSHVLKVIHLRKVDKGSDEQALDMYLQAECVRMTLRKYMASADRSITPAHVPNSIQRDMEKKIISDTWKQHFCGEAHKVWGMMNDLNNKQIQTVHDGYLKRFQLDSEAEFTFERIYRPDVIMIDEAQDVTPALLDIILRHRQAKIFVGDPHQQIYSFRGAVNSMSRITDTKTFYLTQSFRFGSQIAFLANVCLEQLKGETSSFIVGNRTTGDISGAVHGQLAIITRTNYTLFCEAAKFCCQPGVCENVNKVAFVGGVVGFGLDVVLDIYYLYVGQHGQIENKFIRGFQTMMQFEKHIIFVMELDMLVKIAIVRRYRHAVPSYVERIKQKLTSDVEDADIVFSTAHKCKGLEFPTVRLTDDFFEITNKHPGTFPDIQVAQNHPPVRRQSSEDEYNLLYVAATRAQHYLQINESLYNLLNQAGEHFCYPHLDKMPAKVECLVKGGTFTPMAVTLYKHPVRLSCEKTMNSGYLSPQYIDQQDYCLKDLYGSTITPIDMDTR